MSLTNHGYTEEYYGNIIDDYSYVKFEMDHFDFGLWNLEPSELELRFLCHDGAREYARVAKDRRVVTTGFGMSGYPHAGTLSQIMKIVKIQQTGELCQIVLGDLDAYNGKQTSLNKARELAHRYTEFITKCGFDPDNGIIRPQYDNVSCLRTMYLLANYTSDRDFTEAEEDLHEHYTDLGLVDGNMTFRRRCSLALMAADFIDLAQNYDAVLVMLGIDEHKYVRFTRNVAARFDGNTQLSGINLSAIYTRMISGFHGHPKMSKSIPGSGIDVTSTPDEVAALIRADKVHNPDLSPTYQLAYQMFLGNYEDTYRWRIVCAEQSSAWNSVKEDVIATIVELIEAW
ncbi:hypothetical protein NSA19_13705 [Actinomyces bowdenii]|uniref:hypothetical protein n=1 Tax=Actinomyces bowdenii TaxID=131109 RepID=UPI00214AE28A|nr:hypothetical protein [Actinomyces bowdenii]MCR2053869.1 hypothetical protein [Actinomyces bowdenii]